MSSRPPGDSGQRAGAGVQALLAALGASSAPPPPSSTLPAPPSAPTASGDTTAERASSPAAARDASPSPSSARPAGNFLARLRGPLLPRTITELLGEAANRDEILAAFFAFARQFFDYTALFVVQDDLAEGRESSGPGAPTAEVERIALALDVANLYADVRRLGVGRVSDLAQREADRALAAQLRRPADAPCAVLPLTIRRRVVLILHGDRSGDALALEDLPELLGVLPRVSEAFERLILRRKVGRAGETQLPDAGAALTAPAIPRAAPVPRAAVPTSPAPTAPATPALTAPATPAGPAAIPLVAARSVPGAAGALAMLGVPRSAPPPPMPGGAASGAPRPPVARPDSSGDDVVVEVSAAPPDDDDEDGEDDVVVEVSAAPPDDDDEDGEDDVVVEVSAAPPGDDDNDDDDDDDDDADDDARVTVPGTVAAPRSASVSDAATARRGGSYSVHDIAEEVVVRSATRSPNSLPPARRRSEPPRPAPRSESPRPAAEADSGRASPPPLARDTRPDSPFTQARRRSAPPGREPSVIVDMGDNVEALLDELSATSPDEETTALGRLLRVGDAALPALVQRFPGRLWFDRHAPHARLPRGRDVSALARALVAFRERTAPYLPPLLDAGEREVRFYATLIAAELPHPALLEALGRRVFDEDAGTRQLALEVLKGHAHLAEYAAQLEQLRATARILHRDLARRRTAIRAIAELRDGRAVPMLLGVLDDEDEGVRGEAHRALVALTRQDFGAQRKRWEPWAEKHARSHRIEWLIDALLHNDETLRAAAGDELKRVTQEYYGYHPGSPRRERERVHRKYQQWWDTEGRARF